MLKVSEAKEASPDQIWKTAPDHLLSGLSSGKALVVVDCAGWLFSTPDLSWGLSWEASQALGAPVAAVETQQEKEDEQPWPALAAKHSGSACCSYTQSELRTSTFGRAARRGLPQVPC